PEAAARGRWGGPYEPLGYGCGLENSDQAYPLVPGNYSPPQCVTVFWIDLPSGLLANFFTSDSRYEEEHGVRIGMPTGRAERLLHRRLLTGCGKNIYLPSAGDLRLTIAFDGGQVFAFALHSR